MRDDVLRRSCMRHASTSIFLADAFVLGEVISRVLARWCGLEYISILYFAVVSSDSQLSANLLRHPVRGTSLEHGS
eukprot:SAG31_NODE_7337_length_1715_cov_59.892327_3_plen_76_part_00